MSCLSIGLCAILFVSVASASFFSDALQTAYEKANKDLSAAILRDTQKLQLLEDTNPIELLDDGPIAIENEIWRKIVEVRSNASLESKAKNKFIDSIKNKYNDVSNELVRLERKIQNCGHDRSSANSTMQSILCVKEVGTKATLASVKILPEILLELKKFSRPINSP